MRVRRFQPRRRFDEPRLLQIRADLDNADTGQCKVGFAFTGPPVYIKAAVCLVNRGDDFGRKVSAGVKHFELQRALSTHFISSVLVVRGE